MSQLKSPRPFSTLGLLPFLKADTDAQRNIQKIYFDLSRKFHPDRTVNGGTEEKRLAETLSAQLNTDYAKIRDLWKLVEAVVSGVHVPQLSKGPPPELAAEYFELQELWDETKDKNSVSNQALDFTKKVEKWLEAAVDEVHRIAEKFPYKGQGDGPAPWSQGDLQELNKALQQARYYRRFASDIRTKFVIGSTL